MPWCLSFLAGPKSNESYAWQKTNSHQTFACFLASRTIFLLVFDSQTDTGKSYVLVKKIIVTKISYAWSFSFPLLLYKTVLTGRHWIWGAK